MMETALQSKKRGVTVRESLKTKLPERDTISGSCLSLLCASLLSTDGILSPPCQMGAIVILSQASKLVHEGRQHWFKRLVEVD